MKLLATFEHRLSLTAIIAVLATVLLSAGGPQAAYSNPDGQGPQPNTVITPENAGQVIALDRMGRGTITALAWSPDGSLLAVGTTRGIWLYSVSDLEAAPRLLEGHTERVLDLVFSANGTILVSSSADGSARRWDVASGTTLDVLENLTGNSDYPWARAIALGPDDQIWTVNDYGNLVNIWNNPAIPLSDQRNFCRTEAFDLDFSPDGTRLVCAGGSSSDARFGSVALWDFATNTQKTYKNNMPPVFAVALHDQFVAFAQEVYDVSQPEVQIIDLGTDTLQPICYGEEVSSATWSRGRDVDFDPEGSLLAAACESGLTLWDMATNNSLAVIEDQSGEIVNRVAFSPDGDRLAYATSAQLVIRDLETGLDQRVDHMAYAITSVAFSPDDTLLAVGRGNGLVQLWNITAQEGTTLQASNNWPVYHVTFSPDGTRLAVGATDPDSDTQGSVQVYDIASGALLGTLPTERQQQRDYENPVGFVFDNIGGLIVACPQSGGEEAIPALVRWNIADGNQTPYLSIEECPRQLAFSADYSRLIAAMNTLVSVWNLTDQTQIAAWQAPQYNVVDAFALTSQTDQIAIVSYMSMLGGGASSLTIWPIGGESRTLINAQTEGALVFNTVAFSPDDRLLISGGGTDYQGTNAGIQLRDTASEQIITTLSAQDDLIYTTAFNHAGTRIASGSRDGTLYLWGIP
jgi:WD40 repeat protein